MTVTDKPPAPPAELPLTGRTLPRTAPLMALGLGVVLGLVVWLGLGASVIVGALVAWLVLVVALVGTARAVEGGRKAVDRFVTVLVWTTFAIAVLPLASLLYQLLSRGLDVWSAEFFTFSMRGILGEGGGIYHALMGTIIITALAAVISVPIGVMAAVYLVEYGKNNKLAKAITFLVDVMVGIPSIVAGLFAFALFSLLFGPGIRFGIGGSIALAILMIPIVVRSTEEMLKLVPDELREASYALGVSKWRTIVKIVLPTALAGIVTGVTLAIARVAGETAPLLIIVGLTTSTNLNPFDGRMATLPVFIYFSVIRGGTYAAENEARAWGAALVLVLIVMILNLVARFIGRAFAPKTGR